MMSTTNQTNTEVEAKNNGTVIVSDVPGELIIPPDVPVEPITNNAIVECDKRDVTIDLFNELGDLIESYIKLENEYMSNRKILVSGISKCLFDHDIMVVDVKSEIYKAIFSMYAKHDLGTTCSFKHQHNIDKYLTDHQFVSKYESAYT